jgi:nucleotide-binding universal stress UspA family protein
MRQRAHERVLAVFWGDRHAIGRRADREADVDDRARIVVGVDGSECARAELDVVSVVPTLEYWPVGFGMAAYSAAMPTLEQIISEVQEETRGVVDSVVAEQGESAAGIALRVQTVPGAPAAVLVEQAQGVDLLVVGHRGRGGVASALLGSVVCTACCTLRARSPSSGRRHSWSRSSPRPVPPPPHQGESRGLGVPDA